jgi:hypothetical protein
MASIDFGMPPERLFKHTGPFLNPSISPLCCSAAPQAL